MIDLRKGDCLEIMKEIPDKSIDMVLCDLPYNIPKRKTTSNAWDVPFNITKLWEQYKRIIKENGVIVLFSNEAFSTYLINSNFEMFKYKWYWDKTRGYNFQNAGYMPMKSIEEINVFYSKKPTYNPQYWYSTPYKTNRGIRAKGIDGIKGGYARTIRAETNSKDGRRYPLTLLRYSKDGKLHQAQKPVALLEYLIKTYTNENEIVLDNCMGSGSTGIACINTNRKFIGIELDEKYFNIAKERIEKVEV